MAERKSAFKRAAERPDLEALYEAAREHTISDEELQEQAASWAYGNAPAGSTFTKKSAQEAVGRIRLMPAK
ncbi:MAG: hypothetical protein OXF26_05500 [Alphaproteobacteria bacterium]|nr:hypothetical protein [Alphaproteobacteria bacterium]MCY4319599.1 hypothetical protein [Alphaproteobacteria bacterium]